MPDEAAGRVGPVRVAHVSDLHVGAHDDLSLAGLADDLRAAGAQASVVTGDLTMRARSAQFLRANEVIRRFPEPTMVVLGNHDLPLTNPVHRMGSPYHRYRRHVSEDLDPVLDLTTVRIQGLSSMPRWRWKSGHISSRQADLIRRTMAGAAPGVARVVAMHHPPSAAGLESLAGLDELSGALADAGVQVVLAGHTHVPAVSLISVGRSGRQVIEVVAGTATSHRTRQVPRSWFLLEFTPGRLSVIEHRARTQDRGPDGEMEPPGWQVAPAKVFDLPAN